MSKWENKFEQLVHIHLLLPPLYLVYLFIFFSFITALRPLVL